MSTTYARTINGNTVYAALADADSAGNSITTTYATKTEVGQVRQVPASTASDEGDVLTVNSSGTPVWSTPATVTVDQSYNASSTNAQSGTAVAEAISTISVDEVPDVTSSDDAKLLKATYSGGTGSYAWETVDIPVIGTITINDPQDNQNNGGSQADPEDGDLDGDGYIDEIP